MKKPQAMKNAYLIASGLIVLSVLFNIVVVFNPHIAAALVGYTDINDLMKINLNQKANMLLNIQAVLPAAMLTLSLMNALTTKVNKDRSIQTLVAGGIIYPVIGYFSSYFNSHAVSAAAVDGIKTIQLISFINTVRDTLSYLYMYGFILTMCTAAVEFYISRQKSSSNGS